jgi:DNA-binding NarL/FixJ family response regulator
MEALSRLGGNSGKVRTVLLVATIEKNQILEALLLGARGVVLKETATRQLFKSIRCVMAGEYWIGRESVSDVINTLCELSDAKPDRSDSERLGLSAREMQIVSTIVDGYTNKEIAQKYSISEQTVKHHLTSIFRKVGVSNRLELALFAINQHLPVGV